MDKEKKQTIQEAFNAGVYHALKDVIKVLGQIKDDAPFTDHSTLDYLMWLLDTSDPRAHDHFRQLLEDANEV